MESVVASVSGYHGTERFNLIKLISQTGASYVGTMSPSTTHLVCWKFGGRKYDLAKKFRTIIVNHQWIEDCIKQGKRVPEHPYMLQSGQELGPLLLVLPHFSDKGVLNKNHEVLSDRSNICDDSEIEAINMCGGGSGLADWTDSFLLNENMFPEFGKSNGNSHRSKPNSLKKTSKEEHRSSSRYQEPPLSGLVRMQHENSSSRSSMHSKREKRKISNDNGSTSGAETSHKGRRLVKKNIGREVSDSDEECYPIRVRSCHNNVAAPSNRPRAEGRSDDGFNKHRGTRNEDFEDVEEIQDWNRLPASKDSNLRAKGARTAPDETKQDELSCVICWTEFSSTRGVLGCGHRFCFSCIQKWADSMASKGQISTCPLCKANFVSITKVEDVATSDQKIYSQTIPCGPSMMDIFILTDQERPNIGAQSSLTPACSECRSQEPVDLLISCHLCQMRCIHSYCLDPPLLPWTCIHCKDLQMLYHHNH